VSSDFGQLAVNRHLIVDIDWAMAGAATADAAIPVAATLRNSRRFMGLFPHLRCARTASDHAAGAPLSSVMNSRRLS
jgi:hypothetical protein